MSWADLDKVSVAKPRADGSATLVVRDDRASDRMGELRHLSTVLAIARVARARHVLAEKFGGRGTVIYVTTVAPPEFLLEAVTAAGGRIFDGTREHAARSPLASSTQLDAAFCDHASAVRRRIGAKTFRAALEVREIEIRRALPDRANTEAWWTAIVELAALVGECVREHRAARWIEVPSQRLPLGLDLGKGEVLFPGKLAQAIVEGGSGSMTTLLELAKPAGAGAPIAVLCDRRTVPIDKLTWERLIADEVDTEDVPVVVYVEDHGGTIKWPFGPTTADPARRTRALANLAAEKFELEISDIPGGNTLILVTGGFYAAEGLLVPRTMEQVRAALGGPKLMFVGVPERGMLLAIDGERATIDDDLQHAFLLLVEKGYLKAGERNRISPEVLLYLEKPIGRVQSNLMDARRALRASGVDPDA